MTGRRSLDFTHEEVFDWAFAILDNDSSHSGVRHDLVNREVSVNQYQVCIRQYRACDTTLAVRCKILQIG